MTLARYPRTRCAGEMYDIEVYKKEKKIPLIRAVRHARTYVVSNGRSSKLLVRIINYDARVDTSFNNVAVWMFGHYGDN